MNTVFVVQLRVRIPTRPFTRQQIRLHILNQTVLRGGLFCRYVCREGDNVGVVGGKVDVFFVLNDSSELWVDCRLHLHYGRRLSLFLEAFV